MAARVQNHCIKTTEVLFRTFSPSAASFLQGSFCDEEFTRACLSSSPVEVLPAFFYFTVHGCLERDLLRRANSTVACPGYGYLPCFKPQIHVA